MTVGERPSTDCATENDGSSLRDSGASVSGERALQEQVFINTYIWEKLLIVRLFWAGAGQRVAAQGGWSGRQDRCRCMCMCMCMCIWVRLRTTEPTDRGSVRCPEPCQSVVLTTNHQPRERKGTNTCWLGIGAGLL